MSPPPSTRPLFELFASTAPGLESTTAGELKALGVRGRQEIGGVAFGGGLDRIYKANLWLRTASRVIVRLGRFHASTFYELERRSKKLRWADFLPGAGAVEVRVTCRKSKLYHSDAVAERILSAIGQAAPPGIELRVAGDHNQANENEVDEGSGSTQLFIVRIVHDECEISADTSGELLHRRGYRTEIAKAPLRETLAAAMVLASGWRPNEPLIDPMCGSGTIPIEAALFARRIAPGANRAGIAEDIRFAVSSLSGSIAEMEDVPDEGWILTNPPYGIRVGERGDLRDLYATLGANLRNKQGWRLGVLTTDRVLVGQMRLPLRSRFDSRNGGIPVSFLVSEKPNVKEARRTGHDAQRSQKGKGRVRAD